MKAVVTGSNGFIGSHLVQALLAKGASVRCLVRSSPPTKPHEGVRYYPIDYADPQTLIDCGALNDADVVFHLAGVTKQVSLEGFRQGNVVPTRHLIEAITQLQTPLSRFVLVSSQAASGPADSADCPSRESDPPRPVEDYGRSKLEAEQLFGSSSIAFPYTIIRPPSVYGPRDVDFLPMFKQLQKGLGLYPGNKNSFVSLIHVSDLVDGILLAASSSKALNETYFLAREVAVTWQEIYGIAAEATQKAMVEFNIPFSLIAVAGHMGDAFSRFTGKISLINSNKIRLSRPKYWVCSPEKAHADFGFQAKISMQEGMHSTLAWYQNEGWI